MKERKNNSMSIGGVTEYDVTKVVKNLKKKVSKDSNDIDMTIIKTIIDDIVTPFTYICIQSFLSGTFPNKMKLAKVIPLYKNGNHNVITNYRPVSLLPQFSKILEKLFSGKLDAFIEKENILNESQYGFRSNRSTSMALLELIEKITSAVDNKKRPLIQSIISYYSQNWSTMVLEVLHMIGLRVISVNESNTLV